MLLLLPAAKTRAAIDDCSAADFKSARPFEGSTNSGFPSASFAVADFNGDRKVDLAETDAGAGTLRQVAEDQDLYAAEVNRAFVLAQFFGYLRRNPNETPDLYYTGYDFWLTKLNQFNGDYIAAEMAKAFISSDEYRKRFGPSPLRLRQRLEQQF